MESIREILRRLGSFFRRARIGVAGLWLFFLYGLFSLFAVLAFSAFQLQLSIYTQDASRTTPLALWEVGNLYSRWKADSDLLDATANQLQTIGVSIKDKTGKVAELEKFMRASYDDCRAEFRNNIVVLQKNLEKLDAEYANVLARKIDNSNLCRRGYANDFFDSYLNTILEKQAIRDSSKQPAKVQQAQALSRDIRVDVLPAVTLDPSIRNLLNRYDKDALNAIIFEKITQASDLYRTIVYNVAQLEQLRAEQRESLGNIEKLRSRLGLILVEDSGKRLDSKIGDYLVTLSYFDSVERIPLLGTVVPNFTRMPPDTLTLILVLAMGALGGTIQLSRKHLKASDPTNRQQPIPPSYYLFRPFLGAITALSVFILVKAGVLVASIPSRAGEGANLSPFFISFLGIISGLLAEQALETIERLGHRIFSDTERSEPNRYAYGLGELVAPAGSSEQTQENNITHLASALGKSPEDIKRWAAESQPVENEIQQLIAAYYHVPKRQLFTDIPP